MNLIIRNLFTPLLFLLLITIAPSHAQHGWMPDLLTKPELADEIYLPDFSYAGYHFGEKNIPEHSGTVLNVTDFGAVADNELDDTPAILAALEKANTLEGPVVILFPPGRFTITQIIRINRSNLVFRGAGSGRSGTTLYFPRPLMYVPDPPELAELRKYLVDLDKVQRERDRGIDLPFSQYAWSGGFFWTGTPGSRPKPYLKEYDEPVEAVARLLAGTRGEYVISVEQTSGIEQGERYKINWFNKDGEDGSFLDHLYDHQDLTIGSHHWNYPERPLITQIVEVAHVDEQRNTIRIRDPLLHDIRPEWHPVLSKWEHLEEVGIEHFRFEFPDAAYVAHHVEQGYNAIYLTGLFNSWVRNLEINNADSGILTEDISNVTIDNIRTTGDNLAHYSVALGKVHNVLVRRLWVKNEVIHPLSFNTLSTKSVFTNSIVFNDPVLDQHAGANHQNLFDNLVLWIDHPIGETGNFELFKTGGARYWHPAHGGFNTFYNIELNFSSKPVSDRLPQITLDGTRNGASARILGIHSNLDIPLKIDYYAEPYVEGLNMRPEIRSLYEYQLKERLRSRKTGKRFIFLEEELLEQARSEIERDNPLFMPAFNQLLADADQALEEGPWSVLDKKHVPPSGDMRDYYSRGPYWWPDPDQPDGLPYIRRDGEVNPEREEFDRNSMRNTMNNTHTLALAYYFSGEESYAEKAVELLHSWFLDPETGMNPHLRFAQAIPGRVDGRGIGIIDAAAFRNIPDILALLDNSPSLTPAVTQGLNDWFREYLIWVWNHEFGSDERVHPNNHGTAYDYQVASIALYTGNIALAMKIFQDAKTHRIDLHIEPDGRQPHELARTLSYNYSTGNLRNLISTAIAAQNAGMDLFGYTGSNGQSIRVALEFMIPYMMGEKEWPYEQIREISRASGLRLLTLAGWYYDDERYQQLARTLLHEHPELRSDAIHLLYPLISNY